jgi:hypothetical protein
MFSMLAHKPNFIPPTRIRLWEVYGVCIDGVCIDGVCIDGMFLAGKLRVWKQWLKFHQGLCV